MTEPTIVGTATMLPDRTIVLDLRTNEGGTFGMAQFRYPPSHPQYAMIDRHIGGIAPGQSKPVPAFPAR